MKQIQKLSSSLLIVLNSLIFILPLFLIAYWLGITSNAKLPFIREFFPRIIDAPEHVVELSTVSWTSFAALIGLTSDFMANLPIFLSLFVLKSLFKNYQSGQIFNLSNAHYYRQLGLLFFLDALIFKPISYVLIILSVTIANPVGQRYLALSFGTPNLAVLFVGAIVVAISWVMKEAALLNEDQQLTI